jgi:hypothetical protein
MAEKLISPGVFTQENDNSFLPSGTGNIGAAFIGTTTKGPAFRPTVVTSYQDFIDQFGDQNASTYIPYAVKSYLKSASTATIIRVMGTEPWNQAGAFTLVGPGNKPLATLLPTSGNGQVLAFSGSTNTTNAFTITSSYGSLACSLNPTSANYITKLFSTSPFPAGSGLTANYYLYRLLPNAASASAALAQAITGSSHTMSFSGANASYEDAKTPYITSQIASGQTFNLFKVGRISDGTEGNYDVKVTIEDIKRPGSVPGTDYGTFNLFVRRVGGMLDSQDTDQHQEVLESFVNLSMNPSDPNYILKRIGDTYSSVDSDGKVTYTGDFPNKSKYIYIIPVDEFESIPANLYPAGFRTPIFTIPTGSNSAYVASSYSYVTRQGTADTYDKRVDFGFDFYEDDQITLLWSICDSNTGVTASFGGDFNLDNMFSHASSSGVYGTDGNTFTPGTSLSASTAPSEMLKFAIPLQGGHDGMPYNRTKNVGTDITTTNVFGFDCSGANSSGSLQFKKAVNILTNADEYNINAMFMPGIISKLHETVTDRAIQVCEGRGDVFYVMDSVAIADNISVAVNEVSTFNTNYAATYFPWVKIQDTVSKKFVWVPPSTVIAGVFAKNDTKAYEWYAPAGLNRGGIEDAVNVYYKLNQTDRDQLYINRINPIASFPGSGIVAWGQKTLQTKASALDRINVRRLLIATKKYISSATNYLVFEQNTKATRNKFLNMVTPYLETVKQQQGLYAFKVVMDETNNTPDIIDRNIMYGQIYLQPTKTAEFILIDFNIQSTGAQFSNA